MKFFFIIPPLPHLKLLETKMKTAFCLAHFCVPEINPNYEEYIKFFQKKAKSGYHVLMDNGAAEHSLVSEEILINLAEQIRPTELIAPDVLFDKFTTLDNLYGFTNELEERDSSLLKSTKIVAVPQGTNEKEWISCYLEMLDNPIVKTIGFSKFSVPKCFSKRTDSMLISTNRRFLINNLNNFGLLEKPIHLLGMRSITEFFEYKNIPQIRSVDSAFLVLMALQNKVLNKDETFDVISETHEDYFNMVLTNFQIKNLKLNIQEMADVLGCRVY